MIDESAALGAEVAWDANWQAYLELSFAKRLEKTALVTRQHRGPLTVQRPFYPEGGICHLYLLHPPGGVVGGDQLRIQASVASQAQALLTTPAAGKFYRSDGRQANQRISLQIADQASLEWLPQENIVYEGARLVSDMDIQLAEAGRFIGWEVLALGRPAAGEAFNQGEVTLNWRISYNEKLLYLERFQLNAQVMQARWGLAGHSVCGTLFAYPATAEHLALVQALIGEHSGRGVTRIANLLICRAVDDRCDWLRGFFEHVWELLRPDIIGQPACPPRIWAT